MFYRIFDTIRAFFDCYTKNVRIWYLHNCNMYSPVPGRVNDYNTIAAEKIGREKYYFHLPLPKCLSANNILFTMKIK